MRTCLALPYMLGISFFNKKNKNKNLGRRCGTLFLSFDSFSDIACVFA